MGKLGRICKVGCLSLTVLLLLAVAGFAGFVWHVRRAAPPWPERIPGVRLEPSRPVLREADVKPDNAYYYIRQLTNWHAALKLPSVEMEEFDARGYRPGAYPKLEAWLVTNAPALQLVAQAAALTNCQVAELDPRKVAFSIGEILTLGKSSRFRLQRAARQQDWTTFTNAFQQTLLVSGHLSRGGALIYVLVDISVQKFLFAAAREEALNTNTPVRVLRELIPVVRQTEQHREPFSETMRHEYGFERAGIQRLLSFPANGDPGPFLAVTSAENSDRLEFLLRHKYFARLLGSTPSKTEKHLAGLYTHLINIADGGHQDYRCDMALTNFLRPEAEVFSGLLYDDPIGRFEAKDTLALLEGVYTGQIKRLFDFRGTQIFLALCAYRQEHGGKLPAQLKELVPAYLPQLPADPFDPAGGSFRYRLEKDRWLIWSLGPNQKDDGGRFNYGDFDDREQHEAECDLIFASDEFVKAYARALARLEKRQREKSAAAPREIHSR